MKEEYISKDHIIQIVEHNKGCQTQVNIVLERIIKEIKAFPGERGKNEVQTTIKEK